MNTTKDNYEQAVTLISSCAVLQLYVISSPYQKTIKEMWAMSMQELLSYHKELSDYCYSITLS